MFEEIPLSIPPSLWISQWDDKKSPETKPRNYVSLVAKTGWDRSVIAVVLNDHGPPSRAKAGERLVPPRSSLKTWATEGNGKGEQALPSMTP